jgi:adenosylhomocysteine nucleosidase
MKLAIQIRSELEWETAKSIFKITNVRLYRQPFGDNFEKQIGIHQCILYESGATKTRAAAACQFAIDTWHPDAVLNLGTCGGVTKYVKNLDVILAKRTFQYDVIQRFGNPSARFKKDLETTLDISWIDLSRVPTKIHIGTIASADQDLDDGNRVLLQGRKVLAADWESASIAKICKSNKMKCLILRGITDIPTKRISLRRAIYENDYKKNTPIIMKKLFSIIDQIEFPPKRISDGLDTHRPLCSLCGMVSRISPRSQAANDLPSPCRYV